MVDLQSLSSSESALLLLISSDSTDLTPSWPASSHKNVSNTGIEWDKSFSTRKCNEHESLNFGSEIILRNMEARKKSRRTKMQDGTLLQQSLRPHSQCDDGSISTRKFSAASNKNQCSGGTFESSCTDKTGRSSFRSWVRRKLLRFNKHKKKTKAQTKQCKVNSKDCKNTTKNIPGHVTVVGGSESNENTDRDDLSSWLGSMSVGGIQKVFASGEISEGIENDTSTMDADETFPRTFKELMEDDLSASKSKIDFRNRLNIYKASSSAYNNDIQKKAKRFDKEASFMPMSFSVASSESSSSSDNAGDDSTADDNLSEAIAKEIDLRRLILGEKPEKPKIGIEEVIIPFEKTQTKKRDALSPYHVNGSNQLSPFNKLTKLTKPTTPLKDLASFFFNQHNHENFCGASTVY